MQGLVDILRLGGESSDPSTQFTAPTADKGNSSNGKGDRELRISYTQPQKTGGAKKGFRWWWTRWVRSITRALGLCKCV